MSTTSPSAPAAAKTPRRIEIESLIAEGGHSSVHLARDLNNFETLAVKSIDLTTEAGRILFNTELTCYRRVAPHKCIPRLYGAQADSSTGYLLLEHLPFPSLADYIKSVGAIAEEDALFILHQLIDAVRYLAHNRVAHRDIKTDNIIINPDTLIVKVIDFGLGKSLSKRRGVDTTDDSYVGTPIYMAPEVLKTSPTAKPVAADLWSAGVCFMEMLSGKQPFRNMATKQELLAKQMEFMAEIQTALNSNEPDARVSFCRKRLSKVSLNVLSNIFVLDPAERFLRACAVNSTVLPTRRPDSDFMSPRRRSSLSRSVSSTEISPALARRHI